MRPTAAAIAALLTGLLALVWPATASAASGDRMVQFAATFAVQADGSVRVSEHLTYQFAGDSSHGITRAIVTSQGYDAKQSRSYPMTAESASSPSGAPAELTVQDGGNGTTVLRIGDPNRTVSGTQQYDVSYTLGHVVNAVNGDVEFNWNVLGMQTQVPVDRATVTVTGPAASIRTTCYQGVSGHLHELLRCPVELPGR